MATESQHAPAVPPYLGIGFGILAVSAAAIFIRFAQENVPSLVIAAYRLVLASLILAPVAMLRRRQELLSLDRRSIWLALLSGLFLALHFASWISSLAYTSVASSVVLVTTTPLWVALISPFLLKEKPSRMAVIGMILALLGSIIVGLSDTCTWGATGLACPSFAQFIQGRAFLGDILSLFGAWMAAFYMIIGRGLRRQVSLVSYIFLVYGMAAVVLVMITLSARQPLTGYPAQAYLWLILLAIVPQLLGHSSFNWALRYLSAAFVSITLLGEPIGSTILAYFILKETPTPLKIFGAILILLGIVVASKSQA